MPVKNNKIQGSRGLKGLDATTRAQIEQALGGGDIAQAAHYAEAALARGQIDPMLLNLAAWHREETGDYAGATC
jgi:hypothetical protein